jgi:hypothetical protein
MDRNGKQVNGEEEMGSVTSDGDITCYTFDCANYY